MAATRVLIAKGAPLPYLVAGKAIQECSVYQPKFASWFFNDTIQQDGSLYIGTPVDVLFLILPALESTRSSGGNFCELEHCLEFLCLKPAASESLTDLITPEQMQCICDSKQVGDQYYYRLNDARVLAWLGLKADQTKAALVEQAAGFAGMDHMGLTAYAVGILGEYLSPEWSNKLSKYLGLPQPGGDSGGGTAAANGAAVPPPLYNPDVTFDRAEAKRPRYDPKEAAKAKAQAARQEARAAKIAKEASGMRKLSSFFSKKT
ncbi:hypothetical protein Ndes2437B_g08347 [Nannochloris sp. 'desiccata']